MSEKLKKGLKNYEAEIKEKRNQERNFLIKSLLTNQRPEIKQIKCGIHNEKLYFGTMVYQKTKPLTAVLTSDKELYINFSKDENEIKKDFKLYYRYDFEYEVLDNHISTKAIKEYMYEKKSYKLKKAMEKIIEINKRFMHYHEETIHKIIALDIISTYLLPIFEATGRTFFEAEPGSGKTRQCTIYKQLGCNTIMSADISKSSFFRLMESTCSCLIIDDFDSINEEQKNDVLQHYKTGYKNTSKSVRTGDNGKRSIDAFRNYGHVVMNNTTGLDDISSERSKFFHLLKVDLNITNQNLKETESFWQETTDYLYLCALSNWKNIREEYIKCTSKLKGRDFEITRPLLCIASLIDSSLKKELEEYFIDSFKDRTFHDLETDWTYIALCYFLDKQEEHTEKIKDLAEYVYNYIGEFDKDRTKKIHGISIFLGKKFSTIPIFKKVIIKGVNHIRLVSSVKLKEYFIMKKWSGVEMGGVGWSTRDVGTYATPQKKTPHPTTPPPPYYTLLHPTTPYTNNINILYNYIKETKKGVSTDYLLKIAKTQDIETEEVFSWLDKKKEEGLIVEIKPNVFKKI